MSAPRTPLVPPVRPPVTRWQGAPAQLETCRGDRGDDTRPEPISLRHQPVRWRRGQRDSGAASGFHQSRVYRQSAGQLEGWPCAVRLEGVHKTVSGANGTGATSNLAGASSESQAALSRYGRSGSPQGHGVLVERGFPQHPRPRRAKPSARAVGCPQCLGSPKGVLNRRRLPRSRLRLPAPDASLFSPSE